MDPNATLQEIRHLTQLLRDYESLGITNSKEHALGVRGLLEHVSALDEWLAAGGGLPKAWDRDPLGLER